MAVPVLSPLGVQAKLEIGSPNDRLEQEADRVADHVMRIRDASSVPSIQRACAECEKDDESSKVRTKRSASTRLVETPPPGFAEQLRAARVTGGSPLPSGLRNFMEPRFATDFGGVRLHADVRSGRLNGEIGARAFTTGRDIFVKPTEYNPHAPQGRRLLAHELAHVVQQRGVPSTRAIQRQPAPAPAAGPKQQSKRVVATGPEAAKLAMELLVKGKDFGFRGQFLTLSPGMSTGDVMFITNIGFEVVLLAGNQLITMDPSVFERDVLITAFAKGVKSAEWLEKVAKVEMAFIVALLGPVLGTAAVAATVVTIVAKTGLWIATHEKEVALGKKAIGPLVGELFHFGLECPELADFLLKQLRINFLKAAKEGVSAEDVAALFGAVLGNIAAAPELGIRALLKAVAGLATTAAGRSFGAAARGAPARGKELAFELLREGIPITESEANRIVAEGCLGKALTVKRLNKINQLLKDIGPLLEGLARSINIVSS